MTKRRHDRRTGARKGNVTGEDVSKTRDASHAVSSLRPKEREIFQLLTQTSLSVRQIAAKLDQNPRTTEKHVEGILRALGPYLPARNRAALILWAKEHLGGGESNLKKAGVLENQSEFSSATNCKNPEGREGDEHEDTD